MILIFGGTTEGRKAVQVIDQAGKPFYYSTKGDLQEVNSLHGIRLNGAMDTTAMMDFCKENGVQLLIDAAHPFAEQLHQIIADVSEQLQIPVIRYDRIYPPRENTIIWCRDYQDAIKQMQDEKVTRLLALTGVQTIGKLKPFWQHTDTWFRILNRKESLNIALNQGFPEDKLLFYQAENDDSELIQTLHPDAIILKESGISGGFTEKVNAAQENKIKVFVVERPALSDEFHIVDGNHGLRRTIEQLLPGFYSLRTGITTGSCATAGVVAALKTWIEQKEQKTTSILLPNGETITIPIAETSYTKDRATAIVIKDAGDDADVTNGMAIQVDVRIPASCRDARRASEYIKECDFRRTPCVSTTEKHIPILITGGKGVGTVTLPGLGLPVGGPAINAGPQTMIRENIKHLLSSLNITSNIEIEVCISVPEGGEIAQRTFNPRLGVIGGISIIGTSGIVQPFSIEAFISSIRKSMEVARASGSSHIVINSGAKSEKYLRAYYADLPDAAFVHYGNYIGETLKIASDLQIKQVTLGIMIGKVVKLAEGYLDTHSKKITMNKAFLMSLAQEAGCSDKTVKAISNITLARELWTIIPAEEYKSFFEKLISLCYHYCTPLLPGGELTILLIKENKT